VWSSLLKKLSLCFGSHRALLLPPLVHGLTLPAFSSILYSPKFCKVCVCVCVCVLLCIATVVRRQQYLPEYRNHMICTLVQLKIYLSMLPGPLSTHVKIVNLELINFQDSISQLIYIPNYSISDFQIFLQKKKIISDVFLYFLGTFQHF
jgi:hypothetical protein